jgi:hypothetical protein
MKHFPSFIKILSLAIFCFALSWFSNNKEYVNYDAIPYVASAYLIENPDGDSFEYSWQLLEKFVSPSLFKELCCNNYYRQSMSSDKLAFESHLPSYRTKSAYVYLIRFVSDVANINEYIAIKIISQVSAILIALIMAMSFFKERFSLYFSIFPILGLLEILELSRLMTPDSLISLVLLTSAYLLSKNKLLVSYMVLLLAVLFRQTNIIFVGMLSIITLYKKQYLKFFLLSFFALSIYLFNSFNFDSLGYWKTFHSSLIYMPSSFEDYAPEFSFDIYFNLVANKFLWIISNQNLNHLIGFLIFNISFGAYFYYHDNKGVSHMGLLSLVFSAGACIAFILIPFPDFRIYAGPIIASSFLLLKALTKGLLKLEKKTN